jgi:hypothetical protein
MSSRAFQFSQAANTGINVLPDLGAFTPAPGDVVSAETTTLGKVTLRFNPPGGGGGGSGYLPMTGGILTGPLTAPVSTSTVIATDGTASRTLADRATDVVDVKDFGAVSGGSAASLLTAFQAAINALPATGGQILVQPGTYSALVPASLTVGVRAVTWIAHGATLPTPMPGLVDRSGVYSLPETSVQANRSARVHNYMDMGDIAAVQGTRQFANHVSGFLHHVAGAPSELESRAYSYDIGTDQNDVVDAIRGLKGRVYATAGKANIRSIYGFAESTSGGSHTGYLTGVLGTVRRWGNANTNGDAVGVRGSADTGSLACFKATTEATAPSPSFCYAIDTGANAPLPTLGCYHAHGGGVGGMFIGHKTHNDSTVIFEITNLARVTAAGGYRSGAMTIADDAVGTLTPPKIAGIISFHIGQGTDQSWGTAFFRCSGTALLRAAGTNGTNVVLATATVPTGTTGADTKLNVYAVNDGNIYIENRLGGSLQFVYRYDAA